MRVSRSAAALAVALPLAAAQTFTDCDPTKKSCPNDVGLNTATFNTDFTQGAGANSSWSAAEGTTITYSDQGAEFSIATAAQAPTIQTDFYIFFGRVEVKMKAAPGTGIISSIVLESDDLDEIDYEFLGGATSQQVETNFFGKANTTNYNRAIYYTVDNPTSTFHTYAVDWTPERLEFIIDGTTVRTLAYDDPLTNGGSNYPQTPMRVKLGSWAAGGPDQPEGTAEWAGGRTDFSQAPFNMYVQSVAITNNNPGAYYQYSDMTGSWQSIKVVDDDGNGATAGGNSTSTSSATDSTAASSTGAPTSSVAVVPVINSNAIVSTTNTGSAYSTNSASISAQNPTGSMSTAIVSQPTAAASGSPSGTRTSGSPTGTGPATQTGTNAASANNVQAAASLLTIALAFFML